MIYQLLSIQYQASVNCLFTISICFTLLLYSHNFIVFTVLLIVCAPLLLYVIYGWTCTPLPISPYLYLPTCAFLLVLPTPTPHLNHTTCTSIYRSISIAVSVPPYLYASTCTSLPHYLI